MVYKMWKKIRTYKDTDLEDLVRVYRKAFAEPPWNEKWSDEEVKKDLEYAKSQRNPLILVAQRRSAFLGFTWGYSLPLEKFPFLEGRVSARSIYMDEIAVDPKFREKGVGEKLAAKFSRYSSLEFDEIVLRTDENNSASIGLFTKLGFTQIGVYDPKFPSRLYLKRKLGS